MEIKRYKALIFLLLLIFVPIYLKLNFVKVPHFGYVKLMKWDASINNHIVNNAIYYQREFDKKELSIEEIVSYIYKAKNKSNTENLVLELPTKEQLRENFKKTKLLSASTMTTGDVLGHTTYLLTYVVKEDTDKYIYSISVKQTK